MFVGKEGTDLKFNYHMPVKVIMGKGCIKANSDLFSNRWQKALIVTGKTSAKKNGALDDVVQVLDKNGIAYVVFDEVEPNPPIDNVQKGAETAIRHSADLIIGIGGGSPMDAAKAIAMLAANGNPSGNIFRSDYEKPALPIIAVPTTAGTGSEVTQYSIITVPEERTKKNLSAPSLFPEIAFLDAGYMKEMPRDITINTAIDAYSHSVESYLSARSTEMSTVPALESIRVLGEVFPILAGKKAIDSDTREKLLYASMLGGVAIAQTGTTVVHAMGYALTFSKNIDHGMANGLLLCEFLNYVRPENKEKVDTVLTLSGFSTTEKMKEIFIELLGQNRILTKDEISEYAERTVSAKSVANTVPVPALEDIEELYRKSVGV